MKKRHLVIVVLLAVAGIWLWLRHNPKPVQVIGETPSTEANQTALPLQTHVQAPATAEITASASNATAQNRAAVVESRINHMKSETEKGYAEWRTPIEFYGKVIDENTNPVDGAAIHFIWTDLSPTGNSDKETVSDAGGLFSLHNQTGKHLMVQVSKQGYYAYQPYGAAFFMRVKIRILFLMRRTRLSSG